MSLDETLYPYQVEGAKWLAGKRLALLADEQGLGKSAQAITAADFLGVNRILVLCPAVARTNWVREFEKFSTMHRTFVSVFSKSHPSNHRDSIVCSYDLAAHFEPSHFGAFDLLILDEEHFLKSITTKRTQKVFGKGGYVRHCKKVWGLTGTPAPNHFGEMWPILYTFGLTALSQTSFVETYCTYIDTSFGRQITGTRTDKLKEIRELRSKVMLRRMTVDVLKDLPPISFQSMVVDANPTDGVGLEILKDPRFIREQQIIEQTFGHLDMSSAAAFAALEGLAGSVSTLRRYVGLRKVAPIVETVSAELEFGAYDKIILFAVHVDVVQMLFEKLSKFNPVMITGATLPNARTMATDKFQTDPTCRVFIGNIKAAGTAITLTAANQVLLVEQEWVPGDNAQAVKRPHRIGQTKPVFVRTASLAESFDQHVGAILNRKQRELSQIFDNETTDFFEAQPLS